MAAAEFSRCGVVDVAQAVALRKAGFGTSIPYLRWATRHAAVDRAPKVG